MLSDSQVIDFLTQKLGNRKAFAVAFDYGLGVVEYRSHSKKSIDEMQNLYQAVLESV